MELSIIKENIGDGELVTNIYSGNCKCQCGNELNLQELCVGEFGTSFECKCGKRVWLTQIDDEIKELLVYEGYHYMTEEYFIIVKQKVYSKLNLTKTRILNNELRESNNYLFIDFESKSFFYIDKKGRTIKDNGRVFFKNITVEEMTELSENLKEFCDKNNIHPNYGLIVEKLISDYNSPSFGDVLKKAMSEYYIENFIKEGLSYLFKYDFLVNSSILEKHCNINKKATTCGEILGVPKKVISYIRDNKLDSPNIRKLQNFLRENSYNDFKALISNEDGIFTLDDLEKVSYLLKHGYNAIKLNRYAANIIKTEKLKLEDLLTYLADSIRMSMSQNIKFRLYSKNLKQRHDKLMVKYKLVRDEIVNRKLLDIHNNISINQYGEEYIAVIPKSVSDFEKEAENQRHCVLSYAEGMANNEMLIVFVRCRDNLDKSHITLEILNGRIVQAKKFTNSPVDSNDIVYLRGLAKANGWIF